MDNLPVILYVDDEFLNLQVFKINFKKKYKVETASNGISGLEILEKNPDIQLIISDMKMPKMTGLEFIKKAKELYPDKKFYILTGYEITDEIMEALNSELILHYFQKPFRREEVDAVLQNALEDNE